MDDDARRWDERYRDSELAEARPPDALLEHPALLAYVPPEGHAVDLACGAGAQSLWLAGAGLQVTALDVSPVAIELTNAAARRAGLDRCDRGTCAPTSTPGSRPTSPISTSSSANGSATRVSLGRSSRTFARAVWRW